MFTGIVEETGNVSLAAVTAAGFTLRIRASLTLEDSRLGDSIAVNGTCLTITALDDESFQFGVAPESLKRTNLGELSVNDEVNLERSVTPSTRMGGHFVQGHVDGTGTVESIREDEESIWLRITVEPDIMRWIVPKGYVALDGISLTVVEIFPDGFSVMLVPYTIGHVSSHLRRIGHSVNIEVDVLGKYVDRILEARLNSGNESSTASTGAMATPTGPRFSASPI